MFDVHFNFTKISLLCMYHVSHDFCVENCPFIISLGDHPLTNKLQDSGPIECSNTRALTNLKILADLRILAFRNPEIKILADFKILAFHNPKFKILTDFKILAFHNPEFKILTDFKILAF